MKLIESKCPNCGSSIKVAFGNKKAECDYCGTSFVIDDETIKVKHFMVGQISEEQEFINAETNLDKLQNYEEAFSIYLSLSKRYVNNAEVWIGLLRCVTRDFTYKHGSQDFKKMYQKYWNSFVALADEKEIKKYEEKYKDYVENIKGTPVHPEANKKEKCLLVVTVLGGMFGLHKFVQGEGRLGLAYLFTGGLFGIGWIYDIVQEYKKWPNSPQKQVIKWVIFVYFLLAAITEIEYSLISAFLCVLAAILSIDVVWKYLKINKLYLRIGVPVGLFLIAFLLGPSSIPEGSYGIWICQGDCEYDAIELSSSSARLIENENDGYISGNTIYYDRKIYIKFGGYSSLVFSYSASDGEMCLLDEDEKCIAMYKQLKK